MTVLKKYVGVNMHLNKGEAPGKSLKVLRSELRKTAGELLDIQTKQLMSEEGIKTYGEAMHKVLDADLKLKMQYIYGGVS